MRENNFRGNRKWFLLFGWLGILAVLILSGAVSVPLIRFAAQPDQFRDWIDSHGTWGVLGYMGTVILQILIAIIPGEPFEIVAGYAFGTWEGTALYLLAATLGSLLVFMLVRRFGRPLVELLFPPEKLRWLRFLKTNPRREMLFLLIFMIPGVPKDLMCYFAGLTDMRLPVWLLICSLGRIPSAIPSTIGGGALGDQNYFLAAVVFLVALAVSGAGLWIFHRVVSKENKE